MADKSDFLSFAVTRDWGIDLHVGSWALLAGLAVAAALALFRFGRVGRRVADFEIDGASMGLGDLKVNLKPNDTDRQIAYSIWVELSTRKLGLPIDLEDDVVLEIYDSWYAFFAITRDLLKDVPVSKARRDSTGKIIALSIEVLNQGLRPHLTRWQARYRRWHDRYAEANPEASPQEIQQAYPEFEALAEDLHRVNRRLIAYRDRMHGLTQS